MNVVIDIPGTDAQGRVFLTWTPVQVQARLQQGPAGGGSTRVTFRNAGSRGRLVFDRVRSDRGTATLALDLPNSGTPVAFWVAGEFQRPSRAYGDAVVQAVGPGTSGVLGSKALMVRVRKDAQGLTTAERDRFLAAFGTLNGRGSGRFRDFRAMHVNASDL